MLVFSNLPPSIKIREVFPLGGRDKVIQASKQAPVNLNRVELYIVDSDLELIGKCRDSTNRHTVPLSRYCVENYFLCQRAIELTLVHDKPEWRSAEIKSRLDYESFKRELRLFSKLYMLYAAASRLNVREQLSAYALSRLCIKSTSGRLVGSPKLIAGRCKQVIRAMKDAAGRDKCIDAINTVRRNAMRMHYMDYVSGKYVSIPLLFGLVKDVFDVGGRREVFLMRLSANVENLRCDVLRRRIANSIRYQSASAA